RYDEPFPFDTDDRITSHLLGRLEAVLGTPPPPIRRRWLGVYSRYRGDAPYLRLVPEPGIHVVTGVAGKGMTVSPAVAAETMEILR
ncbi:MAG: FAD-dependent oxidoreductase, partial [Actinophytocola sp.]|nr:FAD-dependent oxidoreductase [Actinophytocola sp.]